MAELENLSMRDNAMSVPDRLAGATQKDIIEYLFSNSNRLLTAAGADMEVAKDTQNLLAYFSGGEIDNIVRKTTINEIIFGDKPQFSDLEKLCSEEKITTRPSIGFR